MYDTLWIAALGALPGFAAGLLAFKIKSRWCPTCGNTTHALADHLRGRLR